MQEVVEPLFRIVEVDHGSLRYMVASYHCDSANR